MKVHEYNEMMRWLTRPKVDPRDAQLAASATVLPYGTQGTYDAPETTPMPNWRDLIREEGVQVGPQVKDGGRIYDTRKYFKPGGLVEPRVGFAYGDKVKKVKEFIKGKPNLNVNEIKTFLKDIGYAEPSGEFKRLKDKGIFKDVVIEPAEGRWGKKTGRQSPGLDNLKKWITQQPDGTTLHSDDLIKVAKENNWKIHEENVRQFMRPSNRTQDVKFWDAQRERLNFKTGWTEESLKRHVEGAGKAGKATAIKQKIAFDVPRTNLDEFVEGWIKNNLNNYDITEFDKFKVDLKNATLMETGEDVAREARFGRTKYKVEQETGIKAPKFLRKGTPVEKIKSLIEEGKGSTEIVEKLGVKSTTVQRVAAFYELDLPGRSFRPIVNDFPNIRARQAGGTKFFEIFGVSQSSDNVRHLPMTFNKIFYKGKLDTNPQLRKELTNYIDYINMNKSGVRFEGTSQVLGHAQEHNRYYTKGVKELLNGLATQQKKSVLSSVVGEDNWDKFSKKTGGTFTTGYPSRVRALEILIGQKPGTHANAIARLRNTLNKTLGIEKMRGEIGVKGFKKVKDWLPSFDHHINIAFAYNRKDPVIAKTALNNISLVPAKDNIVKGFSYDGDKLFNGAVYEYENALPKEKLSKLDNLKNVSDDMGIKFNIEGGKVIPSPVEDLSKRTMVQQMDSYVFQLLKQNPNIINDPNFQLLPKDYRDMITKYKRGDLDYLAKFRPELEKLTPMLQEFCGYTRSGGGRIGFQKGSCPTKVAARNFALASEDLVQGRVTGKAGQELAEKIGTVTKAAGSRGMLTKLLGPYGVGLDVVFEAGMIGTDVLKGKPLNEAVADNWIAGSVYKTFTGKTADKLFNERLAKLDSSTKLYGDAMNLGSDIEDLNKKLARMEGTIGTARSPLKKEDIAKTKAEITKKTKEFNTLTKDGTLIEPGTSAYESYHSAATELQGARRAKSWWTNKLGALDETAMMEAGAKRLGKTYGVGEEYDVDPTKMSPYDLNLHRKRLEARDKPLDLPTRGDVTTAFQNMGIVQPISGKVPDWYADELINQVKWEQLMEQPGIRGTQDKFFNAGGRVPFGKGKLVDEGRRAFMKWLAGITGAGIAAGTGLLKWGKVAGKGKTAIKAGDHIIQGTPGMPDWFIPLVNRITKEGDDVTAKLATKEREIVHSKKIEGHDVDVYQDLTTGDIRVSVEGDTGKHLTAYDEGLSLEYKAGEVIEEGTMKGQKTTPEFNVAESEARYHQVGPDDAELELEHALQGRPLKYDKKKMTYVVDESKASTDELMSDTNFLKNYAKKKKANMGEIVETTKKKKYNQHLSDNPHEDPRIPEFDDSQYDDYLPGIDDID